MIWLAFAAHAGITLESPPRVGDEVVVAVTDEFGDPRSGETVRVHHGPGLAVSREVAVGITDGRGRVRWKPITAGVAELQAGEEPLRVRVAPEEGPVTVILLLSLLALAGIGATVAGVTGPSWRGAR